MTENSTSAIDKRTGRPFGDHGTGDQAIDWIMNHAGMDDRCECEVFLKSWMEGDLDEWPEFYEWLAKVSPVPTDEKMTTPIDDGTGQSAGFDVVTPDDLQAALEARSQSWARGETALDRKPVDPAPSTHVVLPNARFWNGNPCDPDALAGSLERYAKIRPGGDRDLWAMREAAKWIRAVIASTPPPETREAGSE